MRAGCADGACNRRSPPATSPVAVTTMTDTTTRSTTNPLADELTSGRRAEPCALVIFGATGDLTKRKLVPSLMGLAKDGLLPPSFAVVGFARRAWSDDEFRKEMAAGVQQYGRSGTEDLFASHGSAFAFHQA